MPSLGIRGGRPSSKDNQDPLAWVADPDPKTQNEIEVIAHRDFVLDVLELTITLLIILFALGRYLVNLFNKIKVERMSGRKPKT